MKIYYNFFILILSLLFVSCSENSVLDLANPNEINAEDFWETEEDALSGLASAYNLMRSPDGGYWGVRGTEITNGRGDDFFIRNDVRDLYTVSTFTNTPDNGVVNDIWVYSYRSIFRANQVIENVSEMTSIEEQKKTEIIAEARFIRGLQYFILASNFGSVPIRTTLPSDDEGYFQNRASMDSVYAQVYSDLKAASEDLPIEYSSDFVGRATRGAAVGYLGKAYLYQKEWEKAEKEFEKLLGSPFSYELMENYEDNFKLDFENNKESVFEIQVEDRGGSDAWGTATEESLGVTTAQEFAPANVAGWFEAFPTDKLYSEFLKEETVNGEKDPRMYATLVWEGQEGIFYQRPISDFFPTEFGFKARFKKYQNYEQDSEITGSNGSSFVSSNNERAMRFSDVLLMYAEALTMQGRVGEAYEPVNRIRNRANLSDLPQGYTREQMMGEIRHQRMIEFAREGFRFYDLRRWDRLEEELMNSDKEGRDFFVEGHHEYFPIPQKELDSNPGVDQKEGW